MNREHLQNQVARLLSDRLSLAVSSPETDLIETASLDSQAFVELLLHLEQEFGVEIDTDDLEFENFRSISKIAEFIAQKNGASEQSHNPRDTRG